MNTTKNILAYPVILHPEDDGNYCVEIPDINGGTWTQGENQNDALLMAHDAIGIMLDDVSEYPHASNIADIIVHDSDIKIMVSIDMNEYKKNKTTFKV
ncbi:type II toxin-antitoxin system HicB family antitoxin [Companilactobacillus kimchiensis]|uniref:HicB-like antitoxin of toxin-antitoxin system domain-containing protein n=1 Tax=Companilactobacillus kimchiensis TaxID=993692 RepID=A0A0R2LNN3_9LACO|nr:type II toxin-antitoxin system HicB family antitoxin [Companilactobacillus kimchiensis]KRO00339.1 hypothetical protein IV57_GL001442 [Companilactobacillus kimchiensis]